MKEPPRLNAAGRQVNRDSSQPRFGFTEIFKLAHIQSFLDTFRKISELPGGDVDAERSKDDWYRVMDADRDKFRAVANCWLAPLFGARFSAEQYERAVNALRKAGDEWKSLGEEPWFANAQRVARDKHKSFFHWELEFPEAFFDGQGFRPDEERGFHAVIGNPPYGRLLNEPDAAYAGQAFKSCGTTMDVFGMFIERGSALLATNRSLGMIVPSGWLTAREHVALRSVALASLSPRAIVHLPYDVFPDAYIDCIVFLATRGASTMGDTCFTKRFGIRETVKEMPHLPDDYEATDVSNWLGDDDKLMVTETRAGLWLRHWSKSPSFVAAGSVIRISRGISPFNEPGPDDCRTTSRGFFGSVGRYDLKADRYASVVYDPSLAEYKPAEFFRGKRLIIRRIISRQQRIHATMVTEDFVINKSYLPALSINEEYATEYVLAILNSRLLSRAFVSMSEIAKRDDFPQVDIATVHEFPIPRITFTTPTHERKAALRKFDRLYDTFIANAESEGLLGFVGSLLDQAPSRADVVHDLIAILAAQMLEMNQRKQGEVKGFLAWLQRRIGADIDTLSKKTSIRAYEEGDFALFLGALRANRRRLVVDPETRAVQESFQREYNKSMGKLGPLKAKIAATDRLIDLIVYRLYGLTKKEIAIVEGDCAHKRGQNYCPLGGDQRRAEA
jgi:hypothetical protein